MAQTYYSGTKESERPTVATLIDTQHLTHQKITLDALHLIPETLKLIHAGTGQYVVGLKANQANLYRSCTLTDLFGTSDYERVDVSVKKHGRVEDRHYRSFTLAPSLVDVRWQKAGLCTLLCVVRNRTRLGIVSEEVSYYVSNHRPVDQGQANELFDAIRGHWGVEAMHHKRDVILSEDDLRTGKAEVSRLLGSLRTLVINLLEGMNVKNMAAQIDLFADKFTTLIRFLTQQMIL